jgi:hypothetical protein
VNADAVAGDAGHIRSVDKLVLSFRPGRTTVTGDRGIDIRGIDIPGERACTLYLNGIIYAQDNNALVKGFAAQGPAYVKQLDGSFVIFLVYDDEVYILTDRVGSRKAFYQRVGDCWLASTDIDVLPTAKCELNAHAVACYLANGVMLNGLTLYQGVSCAERASIHRFCGQRVTVESYWTYQYTYPEFSVRRRSGGESTAAAGYEAACREEFAELLIDGVKRRYAAAPTATISLSAGYDVRGILGILYHKLGARDLHCFSYASDINPKDGSDAAVSRKLAHACGFTHRVIESYDGDLVGHLAGNAAAGHCIANFCDELAAWRHLRVGGDTADIIAGDHAFGATKVPPDSDMAILDSLSITGPSGVSWLRGRGDPRVFTRLTEGLSELTGALSAKAAGFANPYDKRDFLYLDQRICNFILPWREYISSQAGLVHNPYLSSALVQFWLKVPPHLRNYKALYRKVIREMVPDLFRIEFATSPGYTPDWSSEMRLHQSELIELIHSTGSRLDEIFPPDQVASIVRAQAAMLTRSRNLAVSGINCGACRRRCTPSSPSWPRAATAMRSARP